MNELIFHNFNAVADDTGGEMMLVLTKTSTIDEIVNYILLNKIIWFYDGEKYHQVMAFKDEPNALIVYFFNNDGVPTSHRFGDE